LLAAGLEISEQDVQEGRSVGSHKGSARVWKDLGADGVALSTSTYPRDIEQIEQEELTEITVLQSCLLFGFNR